MPQFLTFFTIFSFIVVASTYGTLLFFIKIFQVLIPYSNWVYSFGLFNSGCFIFGLIICNFYPSYFASKLYQYGSVWMGFLVTLFILNFVLIFIAIALNFSYSTWQSVFVVLGLLVALNTFGVYLSFHPQVVDYNITLRGKHSWHGKKIVMIADTHYGNIYGEQDSKNLVEKINEINPEIVIIPWDFFDGPKVNYNAIASAFKDIKAPSGVLFANGNHEEYSHTDEILKAISKAGIQILNNKKVTLNGVDFIWVTFHETETISGLKNALDSLQINPNHPNILLKHKPTLYTTLKQYPIDIVVSGHTHSGQIFPISLITRAIYGKYTYGMVQDHALTSITTSGVGTWGPPQRLWTLWEIVVMHIQ